LENECFSKSGASDADSLSSEPLHVIWNHRWEYDKGPERLLRIVEHLLDTDIDFQISVVGERFRQHPDAFAVLKQRLDRAGNRLQNWGYIDAVDVYRRCLAMGDVVLSTALHDFQGLSILEAVAAGCLPLVPERLCYPDWFGPEYLYGSSLDDAEGEALNVVRAIERLAKAKAAGTLPAPPSVMQLGWPAMQPQYAELLTALAAH